MRSQWPFDPASAAPGSTSGTPRVTAPTTAIRPRKRRVRAPRDASMDLLLDEGPGRECGETAGTSRTLTASHHHVSITGRIDGQIRRSEPISHRYQTEILP